LKENVVPKRVVGFAAMATILWIGSARADEKPATQGPDPSALFGQLDANKDGQLTADEIPEDRKGLFERLLRNADKNGDGKLSAEEFADGLKSRERPKPAGGPAGEGPLDPERMFKRLDANHDGKVTLDEVPEPRREMFKRLLARGDKNGDGALQEQEFIQAFAGVAASTGQPGAGQRPDGRPDPKRLFQRFDKNGDGKVTLGEVPEERKKMLERMIHRAGKSGDQGLTLDEFTAAFTALRPDKGQPPATAGKPAPPAAVPGISRASLFGALDTDHDGKLSSGEIAAAAEIIRKLDTDGDGYVTVQEIMAQNPEEPAAK
jgi:Ca2+-binding EF-hand superfamily protein